MAPAAKAKEPVSSPIAAAIELCRRPFTTAAVKWKIQANPKADDKPATVVAFIDARLAGERLNAAGLLWSDEYKVLAGGGVECTITAFLSAGTFESVRRSDVGHATNSDRGMEIKSLYSDAFKRAAVKFGVGVSIYALPLKRLYAKDGHIKQLGRSWVITAAGQKALDAHYEEWLEKIGTPQFGEPVNHGDVDGAQGDVESVDRQSDETVASESSAPEKPPTAPETKPEPEPTPAPGDDEPTGEKGAIAIIEMYGQSGKKLEDIKAWLVSRKVEGVDALTEEGMTLDDLGVYLGALPKKIGSGLYVYLRNAKKKREREAAEAGE